MKVSEFIDDCKNIETSMNDVMYNEVKGYTPGMWKTYSIHNDKEIRGFFGEYRWLSNFHQAATFFDGVTYPSSEAAYQASKIKPEFREPYYTCSAANSKRLSKEDKKNHSKMLYTAEDFDEKKFGIMKRIVFDKFYRNLHLKEQLLETELMYLEETNHWGDVFWGVDKDKGGKNNLGIILMHIRNIFKYHEL